MLNRRLVAIITLFCCFFESIGKDMNDSLGSKLGKPVQRHVYLEYGITGLSKKEFIYTSELSKILLVGEPSLISFARRLPLIGSLVDPLTSIPLWLFYNRIEKFIKIAEKASQEQLQEAIEDALLLSPVNSHYTNAYSVSKLLDKLDKALQNKIVYIKNQIKQDFKWDQKSVSSIKKSVAFTAGLMAIVGITNKYVGGAAGDKVSNVKFLNAIATLGLLPASYRVLKGCYKVLSINPNSCNQYLDKYEKLLAFVQKLKAQLEAEGFITFNLANGRTATLKDYKLIFN